MSIPYTIANGVDTSFSTKLNSNFSYLDSIIPAVKSSSTSSYTWTGTDTSYKNLVTLSIPANSITNYIIILFDVNLFGGFRNGEGDFYAMFNILIGTTGSETQKVEYTFETITNGSETCSINNSRKSLVYFYTPTSTEKSTGFNIKLQGKAAGSAPSRLSTCTLYSPYIIGI